jgi:hypothetical protein
LAPGSISLLICNATCGHRVFRAYSVRIELWRPRTLASTRVFTRMTIFYKRHRPRGEPHHYTFTDTYRARGGGYSWGPPTELGYCVHTHGLRPWPTCKNIHSLP